LLAAEPQKISSLPGWRHLALKSVGSTNVVALEQAASGGRGQIWVTAEEQLQGKARRGREWVSRPGNLYASLLLIDPAEPDRLATLPLVVSLALHKAMLEVAPQFSDSLAIKWPNDILLYDKKVSGILLEATKLKDGRLAVVIGCGINCQHFPDNPLYPATSFQAEGFKLEPEVLFAALAQTIATELRIWSQGAGFSIVRKEWLERSKGLGEPIIVRFPDREIAGTFVDIDKDGFLMLQSENGVVQPISAADIFFAQTGEFGA